MDHGVSRGEVQANAAGFQADEEDRNTFVFVESINLLLPILR